MEKNENIHIKRFRNFEKALTFLESLNDNFLFRGHIEEKFKL